VQYTCSIHAVQCVGLCKCRSTPVAYMQCGVYNTLTGCLSVSPSLHVIVICCPVLIIDDAQKDNDKKIVMEFTFVQPVMSVRLRMDRY